jgi:hypothetical protein
LKKVPDLDLLHLWPLLAHDPALDALELGGQLEQLEHLLVERLRHRLPTLLAVANFGN